MTKEELLDDIRSHFEKALDEKYEDFEVGLERGNGELSMNITGAYDGYKSFHVSIPIELEEEKKEIGHERTNGRLSNSP